MPAEESSPPLRWTRLLSVGLMALFATELAAQIFIYAWSGERFRSLSKYNWSPYGLVRNNPELNSPGFQINRNGFRDVRDYEKRKPENTLRVMLLGGSVLYSGVVAPSLAEEGRVTSSETIAPFLAAKLRQDPQLADLDIEVMNAGVSFNTIMEISTSYLAEWLFWDPDVVILLGSANNVPREVPTSEQMLDRSFQFQSPHAWVQEFDRLVVEKSLRSLVENSLRVAEDQLVSIAMARLVVTKLVDGLWSRAKAARLDRGERVQTSSGGTPASREEIAVYVRDYAGFVEAVVAAARRQDQEVAFFWEYFLGYLQGIKPFSEQEKWLYPRIERGDSGREHQLYMRDQLRDLLAEHDVPLIDPLPELRRHEETVFIDYLHYTRHGNELMADVIYDRMKQSFRARAERIRNAPASGPGSIQD